MIHDSLMVFCNHHIRCGTNLVTFYIEKKIWTRTIIVGGMHIYFIRNVKNVSKNNEPNMVLSVTIVELPKHLLLIPIRIKKHFGK